MLLNPPAIYEKITVKPPEEHYVLFYYAEEPSPNALRQAIRYGKDHRLKLVETTNLPIKGGIAQEEGAESVFHYDLGLDEWVGYIRYADCVFTNSFHAICFCLLFEKEFFAGSRHGDKISNLLWTFGLQNRKLGTRDRNQGKLSFKEKVFRKLDSMGLADCEGDFKWPEKINYAKVNGILKQKAEESAEFILDAIHDAETKERPMRDYSGYKKTLSYQALYNSRKKHMEYTWSDIPSEGRMRTLPEGNLEFTPSLPPLVNDGTARLVKNGFQLEGYQFRGWNIRVKIDQHWFWYLEDGSLALKESYNGKEGKPRFLFEDEAVLPFFPVNSIALIVAEAVWEKKADCKD